MEQKKGCMVISLDFELAWGRFDVCGIENYRKNFLGARKAIPEILNLFEHYNIHATWATVGFLFAENKEEILKHLPRQLPNYENFNTQIPEYLSRVGTDEENDPIHFAASIIRTINAAANQEIGSHTCSHYYCKEPGQNIDIFREDLLSAIEIAKLHDIALTSLVLPRNEFLTKYMYVAKEVGFTSIRGNHSHYAYNHQHNLLARIIRLIDSYINICGYKCFSYDELIEDGIVNIKASRFLRPYSSKLRFLESIKINCIKKQMLYAAKNGKVFHLWWHPHNMGANSHDNLFQLEEILKYYCELNKKYGFQSKNMCELTGELLL